MEQKPKTIEQLEKEKQELLETIENATRAAEAATAAVEALLAKKNKVEKEKEEKEGKEPEKKTPEEEAEAEAEAKKKAREEEEKRKAFLGKKEAENDKKIESSGRFKKLFEKSGEWWKGLDNSAWGRTAKFATSAALMGAGVLYAAHTLDIGTGSNMAMSLGTRVGFATGINTLLTRIKIPPEKQKIVKGALLGVGLGASFLMGGWVALGVAGAGIGAKMLSDKYFKDKTGKGSKISKNVVNTFISLGVGVGTYAGVAYGAETPQVTDPAPQVITPPDTALGEGIADTAQVVPDTARAIPDTAQVVPDTAQAVTPIDT